MKKAQMLQFLFYTILALVIFIPTASWASQFFKLSDKSIGSYNQLANIVNTIKDGEINSMALSINKETLIFGISKSSDRAESFTSSPEKIIREGEKIIRIIFNLGNAPPNGYIQRPLQCAKGESCLCICAKGLSLENDEIKCNNQPVCSSFKNTDFFEERPVADITKLDESITFNGLWKNGIFILNTDNKDMIFKVYSIPQTANFAFYNPTTAYVQRHKGFVNICFQRDCITEGMIDNINMEDAIKEFNRLKETYFQCRLAQDGNCGAFSVNMPGRYYIYYSRLAKDINFPSGLPGKLYLVNTENNDPSYIREKLSDITVHAADGKSEIFEATFEGFDGFKSIQGQGFALGDYEDGLLPNYFSLAKAGDNIVIDKT